MNTSQTPPKKLSERTGKIVSFTKDKTTVKIELFALVQHRKYKKRIKRISNVFAHATSDYEIGQTVSIAPCRPLSKTKHWVIRSLAQKVNP